MIKSDKDTIERLCNEILKEARETNRFVFLGNEHMVAGTIPIPDCINSENILYPVVLDMVRWLQGVCHLPDEQFMFDLKKKLNNSYIITE